MGMLTLGPIFRYIIYIFFILYLTECIYPKTYTKEDLKKYKERVVSMFRHGYENYLDDAYPYDELRPLSCDGVDTWGSFSLSLIDALDTLIVLGNYSEFKNVVNKVLEITDFNLNLNVSVFETNIRVVGGLLSAHLLSYKTGISLEPGWPCTGPLLNLAEKMARRLLPAFNTKTGMPYGTVNLRYGVPPGETPITCTAGVATFTVEFGTLSRLTGDPIFEQTALRAVNALWQERSSLGLLGNHLNVQDGKWTALDSGIGAGVDSYFEYLVKGAVLLQKPKLMKMFNTYKDLIYKHMKRDDWFVWVSMSSGQVTMPIFQSLEAFWPGLLALVGDISQAQATLYNYHQVLRQYGFPPESYDIAHGRVNSKREGNPLRPELIESIMYLYQATKDPFLIQMGVDILEAIEHSAKTDCGYATIKNVRDHKIEDRMESFFLAETIKYLYLLFDTNSFIHNNGCCGDVIEMGDEICVIGAGGYVFNTEAHPIDVAALQCCYSKERDSQTHFVNDLKSSLNLFSLMNLVPASEGSTVNLWNKRSAIVFGGVKESESEEEEEEEEWDFEEYFLNMTEKESTIINSTNNLSPNIGEPSLGSPSVPIELFTANNSALLNNSVKNEANKASRRGVFNVTESNASENVANEEQTQDNCDDFAKIINERTSKKPYFGYLTCPTQPYITRFFKMGQVVSPGY